MLLPVLSWEGPLRQKPPHPILNENVASSKSPSQYESLPDTSAALCGFFLSCSCTDKCAHVKTKKKAA